ncbi:MAG TPA: recombinase family protein [Gemmataceae bacterium]|jgi:DNA invertase Pin-like site-specific DNA recombinase
MTVTMAKGVGIDLTPIDEVVEAYSYIRFSTPEQAQGDSLRRQTERAREYCARRGWRLNEATYRDLGVSARKGKNALVGNLGEFLKAVESGAVKKGAALIVESLDRITRQGIDEGYDLIKRILKSGIRLVTFSPEREFDVSATKGLCKGALEIQLILERAAEESERKEERNSAAWRNKLACAREKRLQPPRKKSGEITMAITNSLPAWVTVHEGKVVLIPERASAVRLIYQWAREGLGIYRIVQRLCDERVPTIGRTGKWTRSYVTKILSERSVLGEFIPKNKAGKPTGEPAITDYYPAVVTEDEYYAAQRGKQSRRVDAPKVHGKDDEIRALWDAGMTKVAHIARRLEVCRMVVYSALRRLGLREPKKKNPSTRRKVHLFTGLLGHALDGDTFYVGSANGKHVLINTMGGDGRKKGGFVCFPLDIFERAVVGLLSEVPASEFLDKKDGVQELQALEGEEGDLRQRIALQDATMEEFKKPEDAPLKAAAYRDKLKLEARLKEVQGKLPAARAATKQTRMASWQETKTLLDKLAGNSSDTLRAQVRDRLQRDIRDMWFLPLRQGHERLCLLQVNFKGGGCRHFVICYRPIWAGRNRVPRNGYALCWSFRDAPNWVDKTPDLAQYATDARVKAKVDRFVADLWPDVIDALEGGLALDGKTDKRRKFVRGMSPENVIGWEIEPAQSAK